MTVSDAINVLIQGVEAGRKAGVYSFRDAALIYEAIETLKKVSDENENGKSAAKAAPRPEAKSSSENEDAKKPSAKE